MKILYVVTGQSYFAANPSRKILALVRCWSEMGHEVELICGGDVAMGNAGLGESGDNKSVTAGSRASDPWYRSLKYLAPIVNTISEIKNIRHDIRLSGVVAERIAKFKPDIYLQRSSRIDGRTLASAKKTGVPTVLEWKDGIVCSSGAIRALGRSDLYGFSFLKEYARGVEVCKEKSVDFFIVESEVLKRRLSVELKRDESSFFVAHNAVNISDFDLDAVDKQAEARKQLGLGASDFIAVFVGSFAWYQGVELLVEAAAKDEAGLPPISVVLVGDGPGRNGVESLAKELGVEERIKFVGKVSYDKVPLYLSAANAAVLPDCTEIICPIKILEYMAMGATAVLPDYEANREVVEHDVTGILFSPRNPDALHNALRRLQKNPGKNIEIGAAGRKRAAESFSWASTWGLAIEDISDIAQ